jgi:hypothetical protein
VDYSDWVSVVSEVVSLALFVEEDVDDVSVEVVLLNVKTES